MLLYRPPGCQVEKGGPQWRSPSLLLQCPPLEKDPSGRIAATPSKSCGLGWRSPRRDCVPRYCLEGSIGLHPKSLTPEVGVVGNGVAVLEEETKGFLKGRSEMRKSVGREFVFFFPPHVWKGKIFWSHHHEEAAKPIVYLVNWTLQELHIHPGVKLMKPLPASRLWGWKREKEIQARLDALLMASGDEAINGLMGVIGNLTGGMKNRLQIPTNKGWMGKRHPILIES
ncbi:unnamed protein product [Cuscuta campestris]|uniref:Uncharacterized protein n=1 Tax=Cuscuta campestris TaxID=132261 RepID=A0A484LB28_9ASTE|nr:unnamed protein product [Cuscuta campestris]